MDISTTLGIVAGMSILVAILLGPLIIPFLRRLKFGQAIRAEGPARHMKKAGTPTMGGVIFLLAALVTTLYLSPLGRNTWVLILATFGFGLIGFIDDYIKVALKRNLGLTAKQKLLAQIVIGIIICILLAGSAHNTEIHIPGTHVSIPLGFVYYPFLILLIIATSNAVNITDGLDGLASGIAAIAFGAYGVIAYLKSEYDVAIFCAALVGGLLGFLVFNIHPAKVFMGDTGSLALGGALAGVAILTKEEILLVIVGGVFVIETLSVILQVFSFQTFGKRIFKMSPIHHHFELSGWSEWRVVGTFWTAALVLASVALAVYLK
ncbi:MAG: phospho-N-acetylmuramoyl-pentapeptide transferase [Bacilli bacterium]|nr:phospho-N-acetylmuramoyl-pentapeptide transferase [Bacilli bacterium]